MVAGLFLVVAVVQFVLAIRRSEALLAIFAVSVVGIVVVAFDSLVQ